MTRREKAKAVHREQRASKRRRKAFQERPKQVPQQMTIMKKLATMFSLGKKPEKTGKKKV